MTYQRELAGPPHPACSWCRQAVGLATATHAPRDHWKMAMWHPMGRSRSSKKVGSNRITRSGIGTKVSLELVGPLDEQLTKLRVEFVQRPARAAGEFRGRAAGALSVQSVRLADVTMAAASPAHSGEKTSRSRRRNRAEVLPGTRRSVRPANPNAARVAKIEAMRQSAARWVVVRGLTAVSRAADPSAHATA